ncbi:MAG: site-specific integrase [Burkholderiales bacterium]
MMTDWYQKSMNALVLNGKAGRTQEAYSRALRMLCEFYGKEPEQIGEAELEAYFLHRRNVDRWSANTMRICYCGIRFVVYIDKWMARICVTSRVFSTSRGEGPRPRQAG